MTYANLLDRIIEHGRYERPEGTDMWAIRSVRPDFRSHYRYRWPFPGQWADAPGPIDEHNHGPCPSDVGDGLCVSTTWAGMASGGIPAHTLLLCAINTDDALSSVSSDKIRVRRAHVVDVVDGVWALAAFGRKANLTKGLFRDLCLRGIYFDRSNLPHASFCRSHVGWASFREANVFGTDFDGANVCGADFRDSNVHEAKIHGAIYDDETLWPDGFDPVAAGAVKAA